MTRMRFLAPLLALAAAVSMVALADQPLPPLRVQGAGTAGSPDGGVLSIQGVDGGMPIPVALASGGSVTPPGSVDAGTIACNSGVSPCTVSTTAANVLAANTNRKSCSVCTVDVVDLRCKKATAAGSAASDTNFDFTLNAGAGALKTGQCWPCADPGSTWRGPLNCAASAATDAGNVSVSETN